MNYLTQLYTLVKNDPSLINHKMVSDYLHTNRTKTKNLYELLLMNNMLTPDYKIIFNYMDKIFYDNDKDHKHLLYDIEDISDKDLKQTDIERFAQMNGFVKTTDGYTKGTITISEKKMKDMYLGKKLDEQLRKSRTQKLFRTPQIKDKSLLLSNKPEILPKINPLLFKRSMI